MYNSNRFQTACRATVVLPFRPPDEEGGSITQPNKNSSIIAAGALGTRKGFSARSKRTPPSLQGSPAEPCSPIVPPLYVAEASVLEAPPPSKIRRLGTPQVRRAASKDFKATDGAAGRPLPATSEVWRRVVMPKSRRRFWSAASGSVLTVDRPLGAIESIVGRRRWSDRRGTAQSARWSRLGNDDAPSLQAKNGGREGASDETTKIQPNGTPVSANPIPRTDNALDLPPVRLIGESMGCPEPKDVGALNIEAQAVDRRGCECVRSSVEGGGPKDMSQTSLDFRCMGAAGSPARRQSRRHILATVAPTPPSLKSATSSTPTKKQAAGFWHPQSTHIFRAVGCSPSKHANIVPTELTFAESESDNGQKASLFMAPGKVPAVQLEPERDLEKALFGAFTAPSATSSPAEKDQKASTLRAPPGLARGSATSTVATGLAESLTALDASTVSSDNDCTGENDSTSGILAGASVSKLLSGGDVSFGHFRDVPLEEVAETASVPPAYEWTAVCGACRSNSPESTDSCAPTATPRTINCLIHGVCSRNTVASDSIPVPAQRALYLAGTSMQAATCIKCRECFFEFMEFVFRAPSQMCRVLSMESGNLSVEQVPRHEGCLLVPQLEQEKMDAAFQKPQLQALVSCRAKGHEFLATRAMLRQLEPWCHQCRRTNNGNYTTTLFPNYCRPGACNSPLIHDANPEANSPTEEARLNSTASRGLDTAKTRCEESAPMGLTVATMSRRSIEKVSSDTPQPVDCGSTVPIVCTGMELGETSSADLVSQDDAGEPYPKAQQPGPDRSGLGPEPDSEVPNGDNTETPSPRGGGLDDDLDQLQGAVQEIQPVKSETNWDRRRPATPEERTTAGTSTNNSMAREGFSKVVSKVDCPETKAKPRRGRPRRTCSRGTTMAAMDSRTVREALTRQRQIQREVQRVMLQRRRREEDLRDFERQQAVLREAYKHFKASGGFPVSRSSSSSSSPPKPAVSSSTVPPSFRRRSYDKGPIYSDGGTVSVPTTGTGASLNSCNNRSIQAMAEQDSQQYKGVTISDALPVLQILEGRGNPWNILRVTPPKSRVTDRPSSGSSEPSSPPTGSRKLSINSEEYNMAKRSYRTLALKVHPDKNPHPKATEVFLMLDAAWRSIVAISE